MTELEHLKESEPILLFNGVLTCKTWEPRGYLDFVHHTACFFLLKSDYKFIEVTNDGHHAHQWRAGEVGFFPAMSTNAMDYSMPGASIKYVAIPDALLAQAMPIEKYRVFRHQNDEVSAHLIKTAARLTPGDDPLLIDSIMISIVHRIAQWHHGAERNVESRNDAQIKRAVEYLNDNIIEQVTLQELASIACMSQFHFARQFHRVTGRSPHAYMVHKRIERAKAMLGKGALSVATVAYACGFGSQAHFSRQFRVHQGMSPTAFRREVASARPARR